MTGSGQKLALVAGGAGFIGSNLCDRLLAEGADVVCVDNFHTGRADNIRYLASERRFQLVEHDIIEPLPRWLAQGRFKRRRSWIVWPSLVSREASATIMR